MLMSDKNPNIPAQTTYYVYVLIDPRNNQPFYVGKGKDKRVEAHYYNWESDRMVNPYKARKINKLKELGYEPKYKIVFENSNVNLVYEEEKRLIAKWGRYRYDKGGILTNIRLGGEGSPEACKSVNQYNLFGEYIQTFPSCLAAAKSCGKKNSSAIVACCKKKKAQKSAHGYFWSYSNTTLDLNWCFGKKKPIYQWDLEGNYVNRHVSISAAEQTMKKPHGSLNSTVKLKTSIWGFQWTKEYRSPGKYVPNTKPLKVTSIYQWALDGSLIKLHKSMTAVKKALNLSQNDTANIRRCVKTKGSAYGFRWSYDDQSPGNFQKYTKPSKILNF
jgi:hypothetical protein